MYHNLLKVLSFGEFILSPQVSYDKLRETVSVGIAIFNGMGDFHDGHNLLTF